MTASKLDLSPFTRQELEILRLLVGDRDAEEVLKHESGNVREQLRSLERKLTAQLSEPGIRDAIAEDIRSGRRSSEIRDEIIAKVGMMADARTPEMQARYDAAVERERPRPNHGYCVTISGPQGDGTLTIARAVLELLQEADVPCLMPEEIRNPYDGDSIEQLGHLRGVGPVVVQTRGVTA